MRVNIVNPLQCDGNMRRIIECFFKTNSLEHFSTSIKNHISFCCEVTEQELLTLLESAIPVVQEQLENARKAITEFIENNDSLNSIDDVEWFD